MLQTETQSIRLVTCLIEPKPMALIQASTRGLCHSYWCHASCMLGNECKGVVKWARSQKMAAAGPSNCRLLQYLPRLTQRLVQWACIKPSKRVFMTNGITKPAHNSLLMRAAHARNGLALIKTIIRLRIILLHRSPGLMHGQAIHAVSPHDLNSMKLVIPLHSL